MAMYKITVRQVNELTDYVEADYKEEAEYIAKQRVGKGIYNLDSADHTGEIVITAEESDYAPLSEMDESNDVHLPEMNELNDLRDDTDTTDVSTIAATLSALR